MADEPDQVDPNPKPTPTPAEIDAARLTGLGLDPETKPGEHEIPPGFEPANKADKDKLAAKQRTAATAEEKNKHPEAHARAMGADERAPYRTRSAVPEK